MLAFSYTRTFYRTVFEVNKTVKHIINYLLYHVFNTLNFVELGFMMKYRSDGVFLPF
jgi:hypothetical protein